MIKFSNSTHAFRLIDSGLVCMYACLVRFGLQALDMVFIDHNKDLYLRDIQVCVHVQLGPGDDGMITRCGQ